MAEHYGLSLEALGVNLPYSVEAEQAVLGAVIVDSRVLEDVLGVLMPEHFYQKQNEAIFAEMVMMYNAGRPIDFVTVLTAVTAAEIFPKEEDAKVYLYGITQTVPTLSNVVSYANIVFDKYQTRTLINACREIIDNSSGGAEGSAQLLDFAEQKIYEIRSGRESGNLDLIKEVLFRVMDQLNKLSGPDKEKYRGLPTGFAMLDRVLTGLNKSDLIILAARPGVGKTSFALNIAQNVAKNSDVSIAVFSLEMTKEQLAQRILSSTSGVSSQALRSGEIQTDEWTSIAEATDVLSKARIYIDDTSGISVGEIKSRARRVKNLGLVVVDYLQLMTGAGKRNDSRVNEISEITRSFKIMAKELNVPILLLSQLSRSSEQQKRRPMLSDLRDSGSIEQDADIVLFLHRDLPQEGEQEQEVSPEVMLIVAKNRHGETTKLKLHWDGEHTTFTSMEYSLSDD
ncbi:MAG: replicative DNA helicase [Oscillospiraceae bacterium]|nr:replicative DNA helicase [Oscillospiraceae bacterium]